MTHIPGKRPWIPFAVGGGVALVVAGVAIATFSRPAAAAPQVTVYKSATCGCCNLWIDHLRENGFTVTAMDVADVGAVMAQHGVPALLGSCHTATVNSYVVEGHVPADVIHRMLEERPEFAGIAVPGMPIGSPGMEGPNPEPYNVVAFDRAGGMMVYERR